MSVNEGPASVSHGGIVSAPPTATTALTADVDLLEWSRGAQDAEPVLLVPGWSAHPRFYGGLIAALQAAGFRVLSSWPRVPSDPVGDAHFRRLPQLVATARKQTKRPSVLVVAESLGASYVLSSRTLTMADRAVFVAPGVLARWSQVLSPRAIRDIPAMVLGRPIALDGWRLDAVSDNQEYLSAIRNSSLAAHTSEPEYVRRAIRSAIKALIRPGPAGHNWIIQGTDDAVVSPMGAKLLARRLAPRCHLSLISHAAHGLLWDERLGTELSAAIARFLRGEPPVH
jgi:alpha-beta hydrolase superfamily lysophospholipase